jgi:hypothetical protein
MQTLERSPATFLRDPVQKIYDVNNLFWTGHARTDLFMAKQIDERDIYPIGEPARVYYRLIVR